MDETTSTDQPTHDAEETVSAPVTVPNVSPGALSGLDHEVIGSAAQDAYEATQDAAAEAEPDLSVAPVIPDGEDGDPITGEALTAWVSGDAEENDDTENPERWAAYMARVQVARDAEVAKPAEDQDAELLGALDTMLAYNAGLTTPAGD